VRPEPRPRPESATGIPRPRPRPKSSYEAETENYVTETSLVDSIACKSKPNRYALLSNACAE